MLENLVKTPQKFYLTGSRYFGSFTLKSDWDYFTQDSSKIRLWLEKKGFKLLSTSLYNDRHTNAVYRWQFQGLSIDVQLVKNAKLKDKVQRILYNSRTFSVRRSKSAQRGIWNNFLR